MGPRGTRHNRWRHRRRHRSIWIRVNRGAFVATPNFLPLCGAAGRPQSSPPRASEAPQLPIERLPPSLRPLWGGSEGPFARLSGGKVSTTQACKRLQFVAGANLPGRKLRANLPLLALNGRRRPLNVSGGQLQFESTGEHLLLAPMALLPDPGGAGGARPIWTISANLERGVRTRGPLIAQPVGAQWFMVARIGAAADGSKLALLLHALAGRLRPKEGGKALGRNKQTVLAAKQPHFRRAKRSPNGVRDCCWPSESWPIGRRVNASAARARMINGQSGGQRRAEHVNGASVAAAAAARVWERRRICRRPPAPLARGFRWIIRLPLPLDWARECEASPGAGGAVFVPAGGRNSCATGQRNFLSSPTLGRAKPSAADTFSWLQALKPEPSVWGPK